MPSQLPLDMLIGLAQDSTDAASRELGRLSAEHARAGQQLEMLQDYRQDYLKRLQDAMLAGMSAADCQNYQRFINTLDDAIRQQYNVLHQAEQRLAQARLHWQQEKRRLNSFDTLAQRDARSRALTEARREQRANDEISARLAHRRAGF